MKNPPSLHQEPRYEPAVVIPLKQEISLLDWLKANNRLIPREVAVEQEVTAELDPEELDGFGLDGDDDDDFDADD
jgi:Protein of unknown function (DUF3134)